MTEQHGSSGRKYDFLEQLPIEDLEYFLRLSSDSVETEAFLDAVTEVIVKKEREHPTGRIPSVEEAWQEFQAVYNTPEGKVKLLLSDHAPEWDNENAATTKEHTPPVKVISLRRLGRSVAAVATAAALVFILMIGAQAAGLDVFGTLARWTDSTFHHVTTPRDRDETISLENTSHGSIDVQRVLGEYAPTWFPDGAIATASSVREDEFGVAIQVSFSLPDSRKFFVQLDQYPEQEDIDNQAFEQDESFRETYPSNSKCFYIFANDDYFMATWSDSTTMQTILGELSVEELKSIIDSIGG